MKNKELFDKTISILVKAYMNNTLEHGENCACAVGNLIYQPKNKEDLLYIKSKNTGDWYNYACCEDLMYKQIAISQIESTGYTIYEIIAIERAFEKTKGCDDKDGYLGLMSVVDELRVIHFASLDEVNAAKQLFPCS